MRLHFHTCAPVAAKVSAENASADDPASSASSDQEAGSGKPAGSSESDSEYTSSREADEKAESGSSDGSEGESEESSTASDSSASSASSGPTTQSRLSFAWDVLKEAVGLGGGGSGPSGDKSAAEDFPWVEFPDEHGTVHYRNRVTGQVTETMPDNFEKYGRALEVDSETLALTVVDVKRTRWERYREMLSDSPFMRAVDEAAAGVRESEVAQRVDAAREDLQTQWETSQNPIVYRAASAYDSVFAETEQARAVARIQELDPKFDGGAGFLVECRDVILPSVVSALLRGSRVELDGWCTGDCMARVNAVLRARETEALTVDSTILSTSQVTVAGAKVLENGPPVVLVTGMVQQLHCIRNKEVRSMAPSATALWAAPECSRFGSVHCAAGC
jgi:hypothetical protein